MSTLVSDPGALRRRARSLRTLAATLDACGIRAALRAAGPTTWSGPLAAALQADLARAAADVERAADELRHLAQRLEQDAALAGP